MTDKKMKYEIQNDLLKILNQLDKTKSIKKYNTLVRDLSLLDNLANILCLETDFNKYNYDFKLFFLKEIELLKKEKNFYLNNYEYNSELVDNYKYIIDSLEDKTFKYDVEYMKRNDTTKLVLNFLKYYDRNILRKFKKCVEMNKFIYLNENSLECTGLTVAGKNFSSYILVEDLNSIFTSVTLVHEIGHLYDLNNSYLKNNYLNEIYSHYLEIVFYDYIEDKKDRKNVKYGFIEDLYDSLTDLENLLNENIINNIDFKQKYYQIYSILDYAYGIILALEFYNIYSEDMEYGKYIINDFSKNKNKIKNPMDLMKKYNLDKEKILEGETLKKYIKKI